VCSSDLAGHAPAIARRVLSARSVAEAEALVVAD
jgi:hypothetical protein